MSKFNKNGQNLSGGKAKDWLQANTVATPENVEAELAETQVTPTEPDKGIDKAKSRRKPRLRRKGKEQNNG